MSEHTGTVVVSGRVRLARNYHDLPFSTLKSPENAQLCISRACEAMEHEEDEYTLYRMEEMPQVERLKLVERHLVSRDLLKHTEVGAALIRSDRRISIMINEEDHLRIQSIVNSFDLLSAAQEAFRAEEALENIAETTVYNIAGFIRDGECPNELCYRGGEAKDCRSGTCC